MRERTEGSFIMLFIKDLVGANCEYSIITIINYLF